MKRCVLPLYSTSNLPVDALRQAWQDGAVMNESEKQFSFTRAASSTSGREKQILVSFKIVSFMNNQTCLLSNGCPPVSADHQGAPSFRP